MKKLFKWQEKELVRISGLNNKDLFHEATHGIEYEDSWCFRGSWTLNQVIETLRIRLDVCGFFKEPYE